MAYREVPIITDWQRQVINGTIMGGSSIVKPSKGNNCYLSMRGKNPKWLKCKASEIGFMPPNPYLLESGKYFRWHSCCSPIFNEFRNTFYEGSKKTVNAEILDGFRAVGLATWFIDAGGMKDDLAFINARSFGEEGAIKVKKYFESIDLTVELTGTKVFMDKKSTARFIGVIDEFIPEFLLNFTREPVCENPVPSVAVSSD